MTAKGKHVLILGAYGLIGSAIARHLTQAGHKVTGLGRSAETATRVLPNAAWVFADMSDMTTASDWSQILGDTSIVVNCTGALQDGPQDNLEAVHHHAVAALAEACAEAQVQLVQISAVGAELDAPTQFMSSKARGDAAIKASNCHHQIFRPGLVLSETAYGGTAMLRMMAAVPVVQPLAFADTPIQTVSTQDIADAVLAALEGRVPDGFEGDLVAPEPVPLRDVVAKIRHWIGFPAPRMTTPMPHMILALLTKAADGMSRLGWRSPMRSNAVRVLQDGVTGDPAAWKALGMAPVPALEQTLQAMPARAEDRMSARIALIMPTLVTTLSVFWLLSGLIGLIQANAAAQVLQEVDWPYPIAVISVVFWAFIDIALGLAILVRKYAQTACLAMIAVCAIYLGASTLFTPHLWADPLGPMVKVLPAMALAMVTYFSLETR